MTLTSGPGNVSERVGSERRVRTGVGGRGSATRVSSISLVLVLMVEVFRTSPRLCGESHCRPNDVTRDRTYSLTKKKEGLE